MLRVCYNHFRIIYLLLILLVIGTRIGRIRVIFRLPETLDGVSLPWPKEPLAYIEWYSPLNSAAEKNHLMYSVKKAMRPDGSPSGIVIPLTSIRQSCMLFPTYGSSMDKTWTTTNVLDKCSSFLLNNWLDLYTYKTVW